MSFATINSLCTSRCKMSLRILNNCPAIPNTLYIRHVQLMDRSSGSTRWESPCERCRNQTITTNVIKEMSSFVWCLRNLEPFMQQIRREKPMVWVNTRDPSFMHISELRRVAFTNRLEFNTHKLTIKNGEPWCLIYTNGIHFDTSRILKFCSSSVHWSAAATSEISRTRNAAAKPATPASTHLFD